MSLKHSKNTGHCSNINQKITSNITYPCRNLCTNRVYSRYSSQLHGSALRSAAPVLRLSGPHCWHQWQGPQRPSPHLRLAASTATHVFRPPAASLARCERRDYHGRGRGRRRGARVGGVGRSAGDGGHSSSHVPHRRRATGPPPGPASNRIRCVWAPLHLFWNERNDTYASFLYHYNLA